MFCPNINATCKGNDCTYYIESIGSCLDVLHKKSKLEILTQDEKQALSKIRKGNLTVTPQ